MKYMGSKRRIAHEILPIMLKDRAENQWYVEPFVGGANVIDKVNGLRLGSDINVNLIALYLALQKGWEPPKNVSEETYNDAKNNPDKYSPHLLAYIGFNSYGGKWFGGYRRDKTGKRDYFLEHYNNVKAQVGKLKDIVFVSTDYKSLYIPANSIIYCDPPYSGTTKYRVSLSHEEFWQWARLKSLEGHKIFVSEYSAPEDFKVIWEKKVCSSLTKNTGGKHGVEKLFTV